MLSWQAVFPPHCFTWGGWAPGIHTRIKTCTALWENLPVQSLVANRHLLGIHFFFFFSLWLLVHIFLAVHLRERSWSTSCGSVFLPVAPSRSCQARIKPSPRALLLWNNCMCFCTELWSLLPQAALFVSIFWLIYRLCRRCEAHYAIVSQLFTPGINMSRSGS